MGNCIPLDQIGILNTSSYVKSPEDIINEIYPQTNTTVEEHQHLNFSEVEHMFATNLSEFSQEIIIYISDFIVRKLNSKIKCETCLTALIGNKENLLNSFLNFKNRGGLTYPSNDVITLCHNTEKNVRLYIKNNVFIKKNTHDIISSKVLMTITGKKLFEKMPLHSINPLEDHSVLLIKCVVHEYIKLRIHFRCQELSANNNIRSKLTKINHI